MKKVICALTAFVMLAGCTKIEYTQGMYSDVRDWDFYTDAVAFSVNSGYMVPEGDAFGVYDTVSLSFVADLVTKIVGKGESDSINYVIKNEIAPYDFGEWDTSAKREDVAYMLSRIADHEYINAVVDGAIVDARDSYAKDEIYSLYKMGVFSGDVGASTFRPDEYMTKAELAIVTERLCNKEKRARFDKSRLEVSFISFGDAIGHSPVLKAGLKGDGSYDFTELFENVQSYIDNADVACINQETVFVENNFSGYPSFGSPEEMGAAEAAAGFDVVTHATNHAFDRGTAGVLYTTAFWEKYPEIEMLGIHQDEEDAQEISVIEKNGIKIALLNYTYSLNGYRLPSGKEYMVDLLNEDKIRSDMARAKSMSDAIVVFPHWGNEYQNTPSESQRKWAQLFADCGATVIVGHHPHVVQPLESVTSSDGRVVSVYYSLGNSISNQNDYQNALCAMADFKIVKDESGVRCENATLEPVMTHMQTGYYSMYLLEDYPEEMAAKHKHRGKFGQRFSVEAYKEVFSDIVD
ncbi:MAG: CapA family protein [Clostridia bacterium]|nr:CapA family protein [Clostridia bacterium]